MELGIPVFLVVLWLMLSLKVLNEYERGVVFRLGSLLPQPKGPGLILVAWPVDRMVRINDKAAGDPVAALDEHYEQGYNLISSKEAQAAFDIHGDPVHNHVAAARTEVAGGLDTRPVE